MFKVSKWSAPCYYRSLPGGGERARFACSRFPHPLYLARALQSYKMEDKAEAGEEKTTASVAMSSIMETLTKVLKDPILR